MLTTNKEVFVPELLPPSLGNSSNHKMLYKPKQSVLNVSKRIANQLGISAYQHHQPRVCRKKSKKKQPVEEKSRETKEFPSEKSKKIEKKIKDTPLDKSISKTNKAIPHISQNNQRILKKLQDNLNFKITQK